MYDELDTTKGQKKIYRIAKQRNKATKDISHVKQVKDREGNVLDNEAQVLDRWEEHFRRLLNEESPRELYEDGTPNEGLTRRVDRGEVQRALSRMKMGKATGPDNIPVEACKALGIEGATL